MRDTPTMRLQQLQHIRTIWSFSTNKHLSSLCGLSGCLPATLSQSLTPHLFKTHDRAALPPVNKEGKISGRLHAHGSLFAGISPLLFDPLWFPDFKIACQLVDGVRQKNESLALTNMTILRLRSIHCSGEASNATAWIERFAF